MQKLTLGLMGLLAAAPAAADTGLHHHPHGIEGTWVLLVLAGVAVGWAASRFWGRK